MNLWLFGPEYPLFSSNKTLQRLIEDSIGQKYEGDKAAHRPDLLLNENLNGEYLLIEFKWPSHALKREDYSQATDYRHELVKLSTKRMRVLVVGGSRSPDFPTTNREPDLDVTMPRFHVQQEVDNFEGTENRNERRQAAEETVHRGI